MKKGYKDNITLDESISLALGALKKTSEEKLQPQNVEISYIEGKAKKFISMNEKEVTKYLK